jgi:hypothetical protein
VPKELNDLTNHRRLKMGFEILNRRAARASGVAVNVTKAAKAKEGSGLSGFFRIAPDVAQEAGWTDPENMKVQILIGNDEDKGTFLLKPSAEGRTKPFKPQAGASLQLSFSAMSAGFTGPTGGTKEVEYEVQKDGVIRVTIPELKGASTKKTAKKS